MNQDVTEPMNATEARECDDNELEDDEDNNE